MVLEHISNSTTRLALKLHPQSANITSPLAACIPYSQRFLASARFNMCATHLQTIIAGHEAHSKQEFSKGSNHQAITIGDISVHRRRFLSQHTHTHQKLLVVIHLQACTHIKPRLSKELNIYVRLVILGLLWTQRPKRGSFYTNTQGSNNRALLSKPPTAACW